MYDVGVFLFCMFFFFFKQKTAYEMRISDWSSDVCSSDLVPVFAPHEFRELHLAIGVARLEEELRRVRGVEEGRIDVLVVELLEIGRASCRERVCQYV